MLRVAHKVSLLVTCVKCVVNLHVLRVSPTGNMHVAVTFHVSCAVGIGSSNCTLLSQVCISQCYFTQIQHTTSLLRTCILKYFFIQSYIWLVAILSRGACFFVGGGGGEYPPSSNENLSYTPWSTFHSTIMKSLLTTVSISSLFPHFQFLVSHFPTPTFWHSHTASHVYYISYIKITFVCPSVRYGRSAEVIRPRDTRGCISDHAAFETRSRLSL